MTTMTPLRLALQLAHPTSASSISTACRSLLFLISLSLLFTTSFAQNAPTGGIHGRVSNISSGAFLNNARVRVSGTGLETFTNSSGEYRFTGVPVGPQTLEAFYTGLPVKTATVTVTAGDVVQHDFALSPDNFSAEDSDLVMLEAFNVSTNREYDARSIAINEQRFASNLKNVVSTDAFGEVSQGNLGEFMKHIPGVTIEYSGQNASGVQVRGFTSNYTAVTLDGGAVASAASPASTQNHTRQFGLEQANINNLSRIEVVKLPTPDMSANLLGGAVNLVSKSAFERASPELRFSSYLSFNSEYANYSRSPGPGRERSRKMKPSADLTWTQPIKRNFGFVVTAATVNTFSQTEQTTPGRSWTSNGATPGNPLTNTFRGDLSMSDTERNSGGLRVDWRPWERHVLSLTVQANAYTAFSRTNRISYNPSTFVSWGETFTLGGSGTGTNASQSVTADDKHGLTQLGGLTYRFTGEQWEVDAGATRSVSWNRNRDTDKGFFRNYNARAYPVRRINFLDIDNSEGAPGTIQVFDANGSPLNASSLNNYVLQNVSSQPSDSKDKNTNARLGIARHIEGLPFALSLKVGAARDQVDRDINYQFREYTYVGPGGAANNLANVATPYLDSTFGAFSPGFSYPAVEFASPWLIYEASRNQPQYFVQTASQASNTLRQAAIRSPLVQETVTAGYVMADAKFWQNRVRLVGGVRYELTETEGLGHKQTLTGFQRRGNFNSRDYDGYYPSAHLTVNLTEDLVLRAAYANTLGRPRMVDIVPSIYIGEDPNYTGAPNTYPGYITASNTTLVPWEADNGDLALQYYLPHNGMVSVGVFRKNITDFFGTYNTVLDAAFASELGLGSEYVGWYYSTRINAGAARIEGLELSYEQSLAFLGSWGRPFSIFANYTKLDLDGENAADFTDFIPETANLGVQASYKRLSAFVKWNYRGKQFRETNDEDWFVGAAEYIRAYPTIDANVEYRLTKTFSLFASGRNILNEPYEWEISGPAAPAWSSLTSKSVYGAQFTAGIKGTF
jgi:iron complex outermembrane receptor protein